MATTVEYILALRDKASGGISAATAEAKKLDVSLKGAGEAALAMAAAGAAVGAAAFRFADEASQYVDGMLRVSETTGLATDTLVGLEFAVGAAGLSFVEAETGLRGFVGRLASAKSGTGAAAEAFERLGVAITDESGNLRDNDRVFRETIAALGGITNETERATTAMELFGQRGARLAGALAGNAEAIDEFATKAANLGLVIDDKALAASAAMDEALAELDATARGLAFRLGVELTPAVAGMIEGFSQAVQSQEDIAASFERMGELGAAVVMMIVQGVGGMADAFDALLIITKAWEDTFRLAVASVLSGFEKILETSIDIGSALGLSGDQLRPLVRAWNQVGQAADAAREEFRKTRGEFAEMVDTFGANTDAANRFNEALARTMAQGDNLGAGAAVGAAGAGAGAAAPDAAAGAVAGTVAALEGIQGVAIDASFTWQDALNVQHDLREETARMVEGMAELRAESQRLRQVQADAIAQAGNMLADPTAALSLLGPVGAAVGALRGIGAAGGAGGVEEKLELMRRDVVAGIEALPRLIGAVLPDFAVTFVGTLTEALAANLPQIIVAQYRTLGRIMLASFTEFPAAIGRALGEELLVWWERAKEFFREMLSVRERLEEGLGDRESRRALAGRAARIGAGIGTAGASEFALAFAKSLNLFQKGGFVPETQLAVLHAGERVIPPTGVGTGTAMAGAGSGVTINVNVESTIADDEAVKSLIRALERVAGDFGLAQSPLFQGA